MTFDPHSHDTTEDLPTRRARILATLELERQAGRRAAYSAPDPLAEFDRRLERIEAAIYTLTNRLEDVENLAAQAMERAEAA